MSCYLFGSRMLLFRWSGTKYAENRKDVTEGSTQIRKYTPPFLPFPLFSHSLTTPFQQNSLLGRQNPGRHCPVQGRPSAPKGCPLPQQPRYVSEKLNERAEDTGSFVNGMAGLRKTGVPANHSGGIYAALQKRGKEVKRKTREDCGILA